MYENGEGVAQNHQEAANWYRKAAEQGDTDGQYHLGEMYSDEGSGLAQDHVMSYMWFYIAGEKGDKEVFLRKDLIAKRMTPEQIQEAQKQAKAWIVEQSD